MAQAETTQALGIDIGGTGIKGAPVDLEKGQLAADRVRLLTPSPAKPDTVAEVVVELLEQIGVDGPVGLTLPAVITNGTVRTAANIHKSWIGVDAVELFGKATGRDVFVLNDADAAGMAEVRYGAGAGRKGLVVVVTLGTGIGSALFVNGSLVPNTELGHLRLRKGDAEDWAAESVRERDDLSWKEYAGRLQDYLDLVQQLFWPEVIIIGGGISKKSDKFLPRVEVEAEVVPAKMQNEAGIIGAAMFAPAVHGAGTMATSPK
jgi:polyphosphate glucokinase